jgi:hypothetical protein
MNEKRRDVATEMDRLFTFVGLRRDFKVSGADGLRVLARGLFADGPSVVQIDLVPHHVQH